jgi:hypothetical protein
VGLTSSCYAVRNEKPRAMAVNAGQDFVIENGRWVADASN